MKAASRLALDERRNRVLDMRASQYAQADFAKYLQHFSPKAEP